MDAEYEDFIASETWKGIKKEVIGIQDKSCAVCGSVKNIQIHHKHYDKEFGTESNDDLMVLCESCHEEMHQEVKESNISYETTPCPLCFHRMDLKNKTLVCSICKTVIEKK